MTKLASDFAAAAKKLREMADECDRIAAAIRQPQPEPLSPVARGTERILHIMRPGKVYQTRDVDRALTTQHGYSPGSGAAMLSTLVGEGKVVRVGRGQYKLAAQ